MRTKLIQIAYGVNIFSNWEFIDYYLLTLGLTILIILIFSLAQLYKEESTFKEGDQF